MLRMAQVSKHYGSSVALDAVDFSVERGEVMALLGENGAGKSTLVKVLAGLEQPDSGTIEIEDRAVDLRSRSQARAAGIAYVAQELSILDHMSVAENVFLGDTSFGWLRRPSMLAKKAAPFLDLVGLGSIDPLKSAGSLSIAERQLVEIARLLSRSARIAILDEPTAALSDAETARVENVVMTLAAKGCSVIYVTHRLGEVFRLSQRVTILRNGRNFPAFPTRNIDVDGLIERMLGRRLDQMFPPRRAGEGDVVMSLRGCSTPGVRLPVSLEVRRGEILGFAGQLGSGAGAMIQAIAGARPLTAGTMTLEGCSYAPRSVRKAIRSGVAYCSDDRKRDGIFLGRPILENLSAPALERVTRFGLIDPRRERNLANGVAERFEIDRRRFGSAARTLSGGNQQKVALGKWIGTDPKVLLVEEPTRGVDVGARAEIYRHLRTLADQGLAVIFASSDTQEVHGLADRVATFYHGRLVRLGNTDAISLEDVTRDVTDADQGAAA